MVRKDLKSEVDCRYSSYSGPRRLFHWGPLIAIGIILWISIFTVYCDLMYYPVDSHGGLINLAVFVTWVCAQVDLRICLLKNQLVYF